MNSSSSDDKVECGLCGWGQSSKMCTSCAQKVEQANNANTNISKGLYNSSGSFIGSIDAVVDSLGRVDISNGDVEKMALFDNKLFADPPPKEDCPICFLPMPHTSSVCGVIMVYMPCCGKTLCHGCRLAAAKEIENGNIKSWCALCRVPLPNNDKEIMKRIKKRMKLNDALAFLDLGMQYRDGELGLPQDMNKSLELWSQAAELGSINAHFSIANAYYHSEGVEEDIEKSTHHYKLAAIGGHEAARHNLGVLEINKGRKKIAYKHFMIAARCGYNQSLECVKDGFMRGIVTKDEYASTLRAYQCSCDEMKSDERAKAAAQR